MKRMSNSVPLAGLAGSIAATDWPDPGAARAALNTMMSMSVGPKAPAVEVDQLTEVIEALDVTRRRRLVRENLDRHKREAARQSAVARNIQASHTPRKNQRSKPAQTEPEMEF